MKTTPIDLSNGTATGYEISLGPVNLVMVVTSNGIIGCGALNIPALDTFELPAARVSGVSTVDDLLSAEINLLNAHAEGKGLRLGMTGREALEKLLG